ncbi:hypothetical protein NM96_13015 [Neisseria mucosa]|nr:hypothetical protein NM96_13015 [Neisseria mucosa]
MDISDDLFALFFLMPVVEGLKDRNVAWAMPANAVGGGKGSCISSGRRTPLLPISFLAIEGGKRRTKD